MILGRSSKWAHWIIDEKKAQTVNFMLPQTLIIQVLSAACYQPIGWNPRENKNTRLEALGLVELHSTACCGAGGFAEVLLSRWAHMTMRWKGWAGPCCSCRLSVRCWCTTTWFLAQCDGSEPPRITLPYVHVWISQADVEACVQEITVVKLLSASSGLWTHQNVKYASFKRDWFFFFFFWRDYWSRSVEKACE